MTVKAMAELLGCTTTAIHNRCSRRQLPFYKAAGLVYFDLVEVEEFLLSPRHRVEPEAERARRLRNEAARIGNILKDKGRPRHHS